MTTADASPPAQAVLCRIDEIPDIFIRPARRGLIPLTLGLLAAFLPLIFYRDVLKPKEAE